MRSIFFFTTLYILGTYFSKSIRADHHAPPAYPRTSPDHDHRRSSSSSHHQPVIKYEGPIVYSDEKPPIIHFPSPPRTNEEGTGGISRHHQAVKYVPLPHHDLPVLIYQSDKQPPIHVVHQPIHTKKPHQPHQHQHHHASKQQHTSSNSLLYAQKPQHQHQHQHDASKQKHTSSNSLLYAQSKASNEKFRDESNNKLVVKYPKHPRPFGPQTKKETYRDNNSHLNKAAWLKNHQGYQHQKVNADNNLGYLHHHNAPRNSTQKPTFGPFKRKDEENAKKAKNPFIVKNKKKQPNYQHQHQHHVAQHQYGPVQKPGNNKVVSNRHPVYIKAPQAPVPVYINNPSKPIYAEPKKDPYHEVGGGSTRGFLNNLSSQPHSYLTTKLRKQHYDNKIIVSTRRPLTTTATTTTTIITTTTTTTTTTHATTKIINTSTSRAVSSHNHLLRSAALPSQKVKIQEVIGIVQHGNKNKTNKLLQNGPESQRRKVNAQRIISTTNNNHIYPPKSSYVPPKPTYKPKPTRQPKPKPVYKPSPAAPHIIYAGHPPIHIYEQPAAVLETAPPVTTSKPIVYNEQPAAKVVKQEVVIIERSEDSPKGVVKQHQKKLTYSAKSPDYNRQTTKQAAGPHRHKAHHRYNNHHYHTQPSNRKEGHQPSAPARPQPQNTNNPVYIPAPKAFHKPPIIIYQGFVPPVHVFKESSSSSSQGSYGSQAAPRLDTSSSSISVSSNIKSNVPNRSFKRGIVEDIVN